MTGERSGQDERGAEGAPLRDDERRRLALTDTELEILRLLATPKSPAEMAAQLFLSKKTVQDHISAIYRKLDVRSRSEAIVKGMELRLIDDKG